MNLCHLIYYKSKISFDKFNSCMNLQIWSKNLATCNSLFFAHIPIFHTVLWHSFFFARMIVFFLMKVLTYSTAIPYRASTGPEQGFPCEVFHTGKNLFSLQGTPGLIAGTPVFITGISLWENFTGKTLCSLQGMGLQ